MALKIIQLNPENEQYFLKTYFNRYSILEESLEERVKIIISQVINGGDKALFSLSKDYDDVILDKTNIKVTQQELNDAIAVASADLKTAIQNAISNIRRFHEKQLLHSFFLEDGDGVILGKRVLPIDRVGLYIPGGKAPLFSSLLMNVIPAQVAGVKEIFLATPPSKEGLIHSSLLIAASMLNVRHIFKLGGAQAVAAFAYGTESIPKVDLIAGPGNQYVQTAKRLVYGHVGIDAIAGPSEIVVVADDTANPAYVSADILSQAEHGSGLEACVLITHSISLAEKVKAEMEKQLKDLDTADTCDKALQQFGTILISKNISDSIRFCNKLAPEHVELQIENAWDYLDQLTHAGAVFIGSYSVEAVGDYYCGTNHILPTGGTARFSSSLNVKHFLREMSVIHYTKKRLEKTHREIETMAETEGMVAHAKSISLRMKSK